MVTCTWALSVQLTPGVWTALSADVVGAMGVHLRYGINGNGPMDCLADEGEATFSLRNDAHNSGSTQGWYSPVHASKRAGWNYGIPIKVEFTYSAVTYTKFRGKIRECRPMPGTGRGERCDVVAYDYMADLMDADVRQVDVQVAKTEAELLTTLLDSLPTDAQPVARDFDAGVDTYPYAFDNLGGGAKAAGLAKDVVASAYGLGFFKGDGTFCYRNRHTRSTGTSAATFTNTMHGLVVPSSLDKVYNRVRATIHKKTVSASPTDLLYTLPTGGSIAIAAGATMEVWTDYTDPNDRQTKVGGVAIVALVASTHYAGNTLADGTGTDITSALSVTLDDFSTTAKWTFTNTGTASGFITLQKVYGEAVRDLGPQTFESYTAQTYGDRPTDIDMPYQDNEYIGQSAADYTKTKYQSLTNQLESIEFVANQSDYLMTQALTREPGDLITITETVTGLGAVEAVIHSVEFEVRAGLQIICRWGLAPASILDVWQLGVAGASELGETTLLGF